LLQVVAALCVLFVGTSTCVSPLQTGSEQLSEHSSAATHPILCPDEDGDL